MYLIFPENSFYNENIELVIIHGLPVCGSLWRKIRYWKSSVQPGSYSLSFILPLLPNPTIHTSTRPDCRIHISESIGRSVLSYVSNKICQNDVLCPQLSLFPTPWYCCGFVDRTCIVYVAHISVAYYITASPYISLIYSMSSHLSLNMYVLQWQCINVSGIFHLICMAGCTQDVPPEFFFVVVFGSCEKNIQTHTVVL